MEDKCIAKCCHPRKIKTLLTYLLLGEMKQTFDSLCACG